MRKAVFVSLCLISMFPAFLNVSLAQEKLSFTLDQCVEMALENNEEILKAQQEIAEAEGALIAARSDEYLQMNFTSWYEKAKHNDRFETKDYNGTLSVEQLLMRFGKLPRGLDAAQEQHRQAELKLQSAKIESVGQIREIFYNILLIQNEIAERRILRDEIEKKRARTAERVEKKLALELDLLDVELELARQDLRINELNRQLRASKMELLQGINADEEAEIEVSGELSETKLAIDDCIRAAMANRVELKDRRGLIERQARTVREVMWELLPELTSSYRYKDSSITLRQADSTWDTLLSYEKPIWEKEGGSTPERDNWEFSFGLSLPLFDGFRLKGVMQTEKARLEKLRIELLQKEMQIRLGVKNAYRAVIDEKELMDIRNTEVTLRRKTLERMEAIMETPVISQKYPRLAGITFDDVIQARENYTNAQKTYFDQRLRYMLAQEELRRKMGIIE